MRDNGMRDHSISFKGHLIAGFVLIFIFVGGSLFWSITMPLASGGVAEGTVVSEAQNKIMQHVEGGIVSDILITEGMSIVKGQPLIVLDKTHALAARNKLREDFLILLAKEDRLNHELSSVLRQAPAMSNIMPAALRMASIGDFRNPYDELQKRFLVQKDRKFRSDIALLRLQISRKTSQIESYRDQISGRQAEQKIVRENLDILERLEQKQLAQADRLLQVKLRDASLTGDIIKLRGQLDGTSAEIKEDEEKIANLRAERAMKVAEEADQTLRDRTKVSYELVQAEDTLLKLVVRAPVDGRVVKLHTRTIGGVVGRNQDLAEILPTNAPLVVQSRVRRKDIDRIRPSMRVKVRFAWLDEGLTPELEGSIAYISPDKVEDKDKADKDDDAFIVRVSNLKFDKRVPSERVYPGMPVMVMFEAREQTFMQYLLRPLFDSLRQAFREA